ncbi:hypothetical protein BaRGS_00005796, partial [Batillaria attramentaria]
VDKHGPDSECERKRGVSGVTDESIGPLARPKAKHSLANSCATFHTPSPPLAESPPYARQPTRQETRGMRRALRRWICRPLRAFVAIVVAAMGLYILMSAYAASSGSHLSNLDLVKRETTVTLSVRPLLVTKETHTGSVTTETQAENKYPRDVNGNVTVTDTQHGDSENDVFMDLFVEPENRSSFHLTIGLATVGRPGGQYYFSTIASLLDRSTYTQQEEMTIVTMLADRNQSYNDITLHSIQSKFHEELRTGLLLVIDRPDTDFLFRTPPSKRTYGDSTERVQWRSKQNLDYAALMEFSANLSRYYLQVEDDVVAAPYYVTKISQFINEANAKTNLTWARLDVSPNGFIGKIFKNGDLHKLVSVLRTFYLEQPCDFLVNYFHALMLQKKVYLRKGKLFFHQGKHSSLGNVTRGVDKVPGSAGDGVVKQTKEHINPPAEVVTSMTLYADHAVEYAYNLQSTRFFWAQDIAEGDFVTVIFTAPQRVKEVVVETGFTSKNSRDSAKNGRVEVGEKGEIPGQFDDVTPDHPVCTETHVVGELTDGRFQGPVTFSGDVKCLSVVVTKKQKEWLVIREIAVYV